MEADGYHDLDWEWLDYPAADREHFDCPAGTKYLRVINEADSDRFAVECRG